MTLRFLSEILVSLSATLITVILIDIPLCQIDNNLQYVLLGQLPSQEATNKLQEDTGTSNQLKPYQRGRSASESRSNVWHLPKPFKRNLPVLKDRRTERVNGLDGNSNIAKTKHKRHRHFTGVFERAGDTLQAFFSRKAFTQTHNLPDVSYYEDNDLMYLEAQWGSHIQHVEGNVNVAYEYDVDTDNFHLNPNEVVDLESLCQLGNLCTWVGQDYVNLNKGEPNPKLNPSQDLYDRNDVPRMPWHDIACVMSGRIACDFARHFIQRWNAIRNSRIRNAGKGTSERERRRRKPLLIPATPCSPWTENELTTVLLDPRQTAVCRAQALRSVCDWSLGIPAENVGRSARAEFRQWIKGDDRTSAASINTSKTSKIGLECSIHTAYIDSILNAERFVLIENQFFVSFVTMTDEDAVTAFDRSTGADTPNWDTQTSVQQDHNIHTRLQTPSHVTTVKNRIADALFVRILRAHREQKPFRVFIILPLIPGFQGEFGDPSSGSQNRIHYFTRLSLFLGDSALIPRLGKFIPDPSEYISVCGLRTYDEWPNGNLKTNVIYVHSKFMVVDDKRMIIGSANLNDRSLRGKRDSEVAVLIDSGAQSHVDFNPFIRRVRRSLMAEHLGVLPAMRRAVREEWPDELLDNPDGNEFFHNVWRATADKNAQIFEQVFSVIPANSLKTFSACQQQRQKIPLSVGDPQNAAKLLKSIRGSLVTFPHEFLDDEDLTPPIATIENVAPSKLWT
ncbi:phospholipase D1/2 [Paragonimus westermani]|uniref:phospholipase D n=1 Tax=Paragonimus westermani TaxID=34504 RepID=A0A5J4NPZ2_9TREM|nr:phospholipase D1/2 [Paragonimus westermani]